MQGQFKSIRIASILDEFTSLGFSHECELLPLLPGTWKTTLSSSPDLLLVESAWWGPNRAWHRQISETSDELRALVRAFKARGIPTVFWCKEDPIHFNRFLISASLFDFVFTSDVNCIPDYMATLRHHRVFPLAFACQPSIHNPLATTKREAGACFAGSYYVRYPERSRDLNTVLQALSVRMPVVIYDRYFNSPDKNYHFPSEYRPLIKGQLPANEVISAYKGFRYGINMNTVKNSATMFSRRVFELLACGTLVVSNTAKGVSFLFGETVITADSATSLGARIDALESDAVQRLRHVSIGVRKVMSEHTYAHRLGEILTRVHDRNQAPAFPKILLVASADTRQQCDALLEIAQRQKHAHWVLAVFCAEIDASQMSHQDPRAHVIHPEQAMRKSVWQLAADYEHADWIAFLCIDDYYGPDYLLDLISATGYTTCNGIGKRSTFVLDEKAITLIHAVEPFTPIGQLPVRSSIFSKEALSKFSVHDLLIAVKDLEIEVDKGIVLTPFSYCKNGSNFASLKLSAKVGATVDDPVAMTGHCLSDLPKDEPLSKPITASLIPEWSAAQFSEAFGPWPDPDTHATLDQFGWHIVSELHDGTTRDVWSTLTVSPSRVRAFGVWRFEARVSVGLSLRLIVECIDADQACLGRFDFDCNTHNELRLPFGTRALRFGWRIHSSGSNRIERLIFGWRPDTKALHT